MMAVGTLMSAGSV